MLTALVSDLHLGTAIGIDLARQPAVRDSMLEALAGADRIVILGDLLEMRERPAAEVLERAEPFLRALGEAAAGRQVVIVPGNHDYELIGPALDEARLSGGGALPVEATFPPDRGALSRRVAHCLEGAEVVLAYPGVWLRADVYATHGHYLDLHLSVPRIECVIASAVARLAGTLRKGAELTPDAYEAALAPIYAFAYAVVQGSPPRAVTKGGSLSRTVWTRSAEPAGGDLFGQALGRVGIPAAVAVLNRLGLGPFRADITGVELRRAGLRAMAAVVRSLAVEADHVIFGHTHRAGPLPGEIEGWWLPGGTRLHNTGTWLYEEVFLAGSSPGDPYWPGRMTLLRDEGPPELVDVLGELELGLEP